MKFKRCANTKTFDFCAFVINRYSGVEETAGMGGGGGDLHVNIVVERGSLKPISSLGYVLMTKSSIRVAMPRCRCDFLTYSVSIIVIVNTCHTPT